jgi:16S rRNA (cytosine967-C5)-methyltransferase
VSFAEHQKIKAHPGRWSHLKCLWLNFLNQEKNTAPFTQLDKFLSQSFSKHTQYGSKDRKWYREHLFAAVRYGYLALFCEEFFVQHSFTGKILLSEFIDDFQKKYDTPKKIFEKWESISFERFFFWINLCYFMKNKIYLENPVFYSQKIDFQKESSVFGFLITHLRESQTLIWKLILKSVPLWFADSLQHRAQHSAWNLEHFLEQLEHRPPLWLRLNHGTQHKSAFLEELKTNHLGVSQHSATSFQISNPKSLQHLKSYQKGFFEIQDLASQHIGEHLFITKGQRVWDCCAGSGGKTLQIASNFTETGEIYASDIRTYKLNELKKRAQKAGFSDIHCFSWDGQKTQEDFPQEISQKTFDWILVDAPCSGSGTWRRNPDGKYRVTPENLQALTQLQFHILQQASKKTAPCGHLVYSTCSWMCEENEKIIEKFLAHHPEFFLIQQKMLGSPQEDCDSMFVAILKKLSPPDTNLKNLCLNTAGNSEYP